MYRRSSPRKAALNARAAVVAQEISDDEREEEVKRVKNVKPIKKVVEEVIEVPEEVIEVPDRVSLKASTTVKN